MQNVDAAAIAQSGLYRVPYDTTSRLGHVDLADVGSVVAKVIMEPGHQYAAYDLSAADSLSAEEIAGIVGQLSGNDIAVETIPLEEMCAKFAKMRPLTCPSGGNPAPFVGLLQPPRHSWKSQCTDVAARSPPDLI